MNKNSGLPVPNDVSPFERIRRTNASGAEYWPSREFAQVLGYTDYRNFEQVIKKAKTACFNSSQRIEDHFVDITEMIEIGKGGRRPVGTVCMSRYACYLIVQNADPSKEIVALARTYFPCDCGHKGLYNGLASHEIQGHYRAKKSKWFRKNWMSLSALIISAVCAWFAYDQNRTAKRIAHLHVEPTLTTVFDLPPKGNPIVTIRNAGDIPAVSVSLSHTMYVFDAGGKLISAGRAGGFLDKRIVYSEELKPTKYVYQELVDVSPAKHSIIAYDFDLRFYRAEDMKAYDTRELFFIKDRKVSSHADFRRDPNYPRILQQIDGFAFPPELYNPGTIKQSIEAWEQRSQLRQEQKEDTTTGPMKDPSQ